MGAGDGKVMPPRGSAIVTISMGPDKLPIKSVSTLKFEEMTAEFSLPASDASNKEHAKLTVEWRPEETVRRDGDNKDIQGNVSQAEKAFLPSSFRIRVGDLPCGRVKKIGAMAFKMKVQEDGVGQHALVATTVEYPNLVLTIDRVDAPRWEKWFDDFAIKGNNGSDKELSGLIEWLTPNTKGVVASLELEQVGIFELKTDAAEASKDAAASFHVSMYFKGAKLQINEK